MTSSYFNYFHWDTNIICSCSFNSVWCFCLKKTQAATTVNLQQLPQHNNNNNNRLTAVCPGLPRWAGTRKLKPIWILLKQETVSGSGISWAICKSAPRSRQITTPAPHDSVFYRPDVLPAAQPTASKHWRHKILHGSINNMLLLITNVSPITDTTYHIEINRKTCLCLIQNQSILYFAVKSKNKVTSNNLFCILEKASLTIREIRHKMLF